jgi:hypothetical protein
MASMEMIVVVMRPWMQMSVVQHLNIDFLIHVAFACVPSKKNLRKSVRVHFCNIRSHRYRFFHLDIVGAYEES